MKPENISNGLHGLPRNVGKTADNSHKIHDFVTVP